MSDDRASSPASGGGQAAFGIQHRTTFLLLVNHAINAATGILFWLLFIHLVGLDVAGVGLGYTIVSIGTAVGLVAKGGLGTAIMRHVPRVGDAAGRRLLGMGVLAGGWLSVMGVAALAVVMTGVSWTGGIGPFDWILAGGIAVFLMIAWLQDAYFLAQGRPGATVWRNSAFSAAKLLLPLPIIFLAAPSPVAAAWTAALAFSAAVGYMLTRRAKQAPEPVDLRPFFRSAWRNVLGNAAEFLPGLLLVPLILLLSGAAAAGFFGMAWTAASLLFLAVTAIGRSALSQMVRGEQVPAVVRRALMQASFIVLPGAVAGMVLAPYVMRLFGSDYAAAATTGFIVLCASAFLVLPIYVYLDVLRAREAATALNAFPLAMIAFLFTMAPLLILEFGVTGAAVAWFLANLPFAIWATGRLRKVMKEVSPLETSVVRGHPHTE